MMKPLPFEILRDAEGSATLGWAGDSVVYAVVERSFSAELGVRFAGALQALVAGLTGVHYFCDAGAVTRYDLLARSAFVRVALANRRRFASFTLLTFPAADNPAAQSLVTALGENVTLCRDSEDFERRLLAMAPLARYRIDPGNAQRFESAERPTR